MEYPSADNALTQWSPVAPGYRPLPHVLAQRSCFLTVSIDSLLYFNGVAAGQTDFRRISAYVEQQDALIGSLTVSETFGFAARVSTPAASKTQRIRRIGALLAAFGLSDVADDLIGTTIEKGVSGGQKRHVSVAAQPVTGPRLLSLGEPTSGLDSAAALDYLFPQARRLKISCASCQPSRSEFGLTGQKLLVTASIHQPATSTFMICDRLLLLCQGHITYSGPVGAMARHLWACGLAIPKMINPAESALDFVNTDFAQSKEF